MLGIIGLKLFDHFIAGIILIIILFWQTIILAWYLDLSELEEYVWINQEYIPKAYKISIRYVSPIFLGILILVGLIDEFYRPIHAPFWAIAIGAITGMIPLIMIITFFILKYNKKEKIDIDFTF